MIQKSNEYRQAKCLYSSPLGTIVLLGREGFLTDLFFEGEKHQPTDIAHLPEVDLFVFQVAIAWLDAYFKGSNTDCVEKPTCEMHGSDFQQAVWKYIASIPYGCTMTYGDIAKKVAHDLGKEKMSAQAVGGATGRNPISLIVPCHRVMGAKAAITGYGGGLWRKERLLALEGIVYHT